MSDRGRALAGASKVAPPTAWIVGKGSSWRFQPHRTTTRAAAARANFENDPTAHSRAPRTSALVFTSSSASAQSSLLAEYHSRKRHQSLTSRCRLGAEAEVEAEAPLVGSPAHEGQGCVAASWKSTTT